MARHTFVSFTATASRELALIVSVGLVGTTAARPQAAAPEKSRDDMRRDHFERLRPKVKLGKVPVIAPGPRGPLTREEADRMKTCVARLAGIDRPDFGLSPTMSGWAFLPLPSQRESHAMIPTDHRLQSTAALRTLIDMGPDALPFLLDALADRTPTKLKLEHRSAFGAMWLDNELWGNPVNALEMRTLGPPQALARGMKHERLIESSTVKVGDVCLVAIGQIVGRGYQAVRYQPTACIVINSPTEDANLREQVRKIRSSDNYSRKLLDSLLLDYATEGVFQGPSLDSWSLGSELQAQAALRMLYYFPKETATPISERLRRQEWTWWLMDLNLCSIHSNPRGLSSSEDHPFMNRRAWLRSVNAGLVASPSNQGRSTRAQDAPYRSPYSLKFRQPLDNLEAGFDQPPWNDPRLESETPARDWYSPKHKRKLGAWGPHVRQYPAAPGLAQRRATWMQDRVILVASRWLGYPYRHHRIPDWDPPANWP